MPQVFHQVCQAYFAHLWEDIVANSSLTVNISRKIIGDANQVHNSRFGNRLSSLQDGR